MKIVKWQRPQFTTWPAFGGLPDLREEIDRLLETPLFALGQNSRLANGWTPALDVREDKDNLIVKLEVPGMKKEEIEVSLHDGILTISGERKAEQESEEAEVHRSERFVGQFHRSIHLPSAVETAKVKAQYKDGILTVTLPKSEEAKPKQIEVQAS